jgi:hypothetical protein
MKSMSAQQVLDREFLEIRARILELGASFDRLFRAEGSVSRDPRMQQLEAAIRTVLDSGNDRAERIQMIFSRTYRDDWPSTLDLKS